MPQTFCLFPARAVPDASASVLALPELGSSYLTLGGAAPDVSTSPPPAGALLAVLAPVRRQHRPYLVMLTPAAARARVNGAPAPPVAVLQVRDRLEFAGEHSFDVSLQVRSYRGPPRAEHLGKECALCLTPIQAPADGTAGASVYACHNCTAVLHEHALLDGSAPLECVLLVSSCPVCQQPIVKSEGYVHVPER